MRFEELRLPAYGHFTDAVLDLSGEEDGIFVVYGPNEAGKSVAIRAIHAILFGIPTQTDDAFLHDYGKLRIGARIRDAHGRELSFVRRKGNKNTLLDPANPREAALPDDALQPFLGGIGEDAFQRIFCIGHTGLVEGGRSLRALKGLEGESLFIAGGAAGLGALLKELDMEGRDLYDGRRKTAAKILKAIARYKDALKEKKAAVVPGRTWESILKELGGAEARLGDLQKEIIERGTLHAHLSRLLSALPLIAKRKKFLEELDDLSETVVLPEEYSPERRKERQNALDNSRRAARKAKKELEGENGILKRLAKIVVPEGMLEHAADIEGLHQRLGGYQTDIEDRATLEDRHGELEVKARTLFENLAPAVPWDEVESLRLSPEKRVSIQNLGSRGGKIREIADSLEQMTDGLEDEIADNQRMLENLDEARGVAPLEAALLRIQKHGDLEATLEDERVELCSLRKEADAALAALGLWQGTLEELECLPVPVRETVRRFRDEFDDLKARRVALGEKETYYRDQVKDANRKIEALQLAGDVPMKEDLDAARQCRDEGWTLVRGAWLDDREDEEATRAYAGNDHLADAYEKSVSRADETADHLRSEAHRVAELAQIDTARKDFEEKLAALENGWKAFEEDRCLHEQEWRAAWTGAGIGNPGTPREMDEWLDRYSELATLAANERAASCRLKKISSRISSARKELAEILQELSEPSPREGETLAALMDRCQAIVKMAGETEANREGLKKDILKAKSRLKKDAKGLEKARKELGVWQEEWREAMTMLGCPADADSELANARIAAVEELFDAADEAASLARRIEGINMRARAFEEDTRKLVGLIAPDLANVPPHEAVSRLNGQLKEAKESKIKRNNLDEHAAKLRKEIEDGEEEEKASKEALERLCKLARVDSYEELAEAERASGDVTSRRQRVQEIEDSLLDMGGGLSLEELLGMAQDEDADQLQARIKAIKGEIDRIGKERDESLGKIREFEIARDAIDGRAAAAEADERAMGILSRIHDDTGRFIRLRLAAAVLRHRIEQHRAKTRDPVITRASELFATLTCNAFEGISTDYDAGDEPIIVGVRTGETEALGVEGMSDGARDQLFLALRLAYLESRLDSGEPHPFIVDDILINFDDDRAKATLAVLNVLSKKTQVIFFTHHQHLLRLFQPGSVREFTQTPPS